MGSPGAATSTPSLLAFISYSHDDDRVLHNVITKFRAGLESWVGRYLAGVADGDVTLFQDRKSIGWGEQWRERIESALDEVMFFIPIVTPGFFASRECLEETRLFLQRERRLSRNDLILPVYFIDAAPFEDDGPPTDELLEALRSRQYVDWRQLKHRRPTALQPDFEALAQQIANALRRRASPRSVVVDQPTAMVAPAEASDPEQDGLDGIVAVGSGFLGSGETEEFEIVLLAGVTYDIYVAPAESTVDFDLAVLRSDGELVARDVDTDADALCRVAPQETDQYILRVRSAEGSSPYDIIVRRSEPAVIAMGTIHHGEDQIVDLVFEESTLYQIAVIADDPSADLDLAVYDENGNKIAEDIEATSNALCEFMPRWTGPFRLVVSAARGDSAFALVSL